MVNILPDSALANLELDTYSSSPAGFVINAGIDRVVITSLPDYAVISIMGTVTPAQWISDFKIQGVSSATHLILGECESGFLTGAQALWPAIREAVAGRKLVVQGHSRGAGMVPIFVGFAILDGFEVLRAIMYEAPWCVGPECKKFLLGAGVPGIQYWHGDDPVPTVPAVSWLVPNVWSIVHFGQWQLDPFACHMMAGVAADLQTVV